MEYKILTPTSKFLKGPLLILVAAILCGIVSCETTVTNFEINDTPKKIVLNGIIYNDSVVRIHLSQSKNIKDKSSSIVNIDNGEANLYADGLLVGAFTHQKKGYYAVLGYKAKEGITYEVKAKAPSYEDIWATTKVPLAAKVIDHSISFADNDQNSNMNNAVISFTLANDANQRQYYCTSANYRSYYIYERYNSDTIKLDTLSQDDSDMTFKTKDKQFKFSKSDDLYLLSYPDIELWGNRLYLSNELSKTNQIKLHLNTSYYYEDRLGSPQFFTLWIHTYDDVLYNFSYTLAKKEFNDEDPFSERIAINCNVVNGLGILGAVNSVAIKMPIKSND